MDVEGVVSRVPVAVSVVALMLGVLSARWGWRAERRARAARPFAVYDAAVDDLVQALCRLRALVRHGDVIAPSAEQVAAAMVDFEDCVQRHLGATPAHLVGIDRQVRAAMGNCYGTAAWAGLDPRLADRLLVSAEHYWWQITSSYLEHVNACLQHWRTTPTPRRPRYLVNFYAWRRDEDAAHFAPTPA